jgi:hypothetical protein
MRFGIRLFSAFVSVLFLFAGGISAQQGNSGSLEGVVTDPSGGAVANATVLINNAVSGLVRTTTTAADGTFRVTNVAFNPYHMTVTANGFATYD